MDVFLGVAVTSIELVGERGSESRSFAVGSFVAEVVAALDRSINRVDRQLHQLPAISKGLERFEHIWELQHHICAHFGADRYHVERRGYRGRRRKRRRQRRRVCRAGTVRQGTAGSCRCFVGGNPGVARKTLDQFSARLSIVDGLFGPARTALPRVRKEAIEVAGVDWGLTRRLCTLRRLPQHLVTARFDERVVVSDRFQGLDRLVPCVGQCVECALELFGRQP